MLIFKLNLSKAHQNDLLEELKRAQQKGDLPWVKRILAVLAFAEGRLFKRWPKCFEFQPKRFDNGSSVCWSAVLSD